MDNNKRKQLDNISTASSPRSNNENQIADIIDKPKHTLPEMEKMKRDVVKATLKEML